MVGTGILSNNMRSSSRMLHDILRDDHIQRHSRFDKTLREKGRDLTQSYDKSPYTNRNVKRAR